MILTYQDYLAEREKTPIADFMLKAINRYKSDELYKTACIADKHDAQRNVTICKYERYYYSILTGKKAVDFTASNHHIPSNFFNKLNTQRCTYLLGNGIEFADKNIKKKFGASIDDVLEDAGYYALIHGVSYIFVSDDVYEFKATEFVPLYDEYTGELRAGIRFWGPNPEKPLIAVFYEEDGYTKFRETSSTDDSNQEKQLAEYEPKKAYIQKVQKSEAFGTEVIGESNYPSLPIVPLWGSRLHQSTIVGMRAAIDAYDLVRSGFANDLEDCAQIYWLLENYGGMNEDSLKEFLDHLRLNHIAAADTSQGGKVAPYTQEIPYNARKVFLDDLHNCIYEDFGGFDEKTIAAGDTNDHIAAAYQPLENAVDDFEFQVIKCVWKIGYILGIDPKDRVPTFKRANVSNQLEQVQTVLAAAEYLDEETILNKLPFLTVDEIEDIKKRKAAEDMDKINISAVQEQESEEESE